MAQIDLFDHEETVQDFFKEYANKVFKCSVIGANNIRGLEQGALPGSVWLSMVFEYMFFYMAVTKERALSDMGEDAGALTVNKLAELIVSATVDFVFDDAKDDENQNFKEQYLKELWLRLDQYAGCAQLMPRDETDKLKRTALGMLCAIISDLAGHPNDVQYVMATHSHMRDSVRALSIRHFAARAGALS